MPNTIRQQSDGLDLSQRVVSSNVVVASPALAAETIIGSLTTSGDLAIISGVILFASCAFTVGTSGTAVRLRIRQTNVAGTVKGDSGALTGGIAAAGLVAPSIFGFDAAPGNPQTYVLTLQVTNGAAASTVSAVTFVAVAV